MEEETPLISNQKKGRGSEMLCFQKHWKDDYVQEAKANLCASGKNSPMNRLRARRLLLSWHSLPFSSKQRTRVCCIELQTSYNEAKLACTNSQTHARN